jgi:hypothetical protein
MTVFGFPLFIVFGASAFTGILIMAVLGTKLKMKVHKGIAFAVVGLIIIHILGALGLY